jgi:hypothetical protein
MPSEAPVTTAHGPYCCRKSEEAGFIAKSSMS